MKRRFLRVVGPVLAVAAVGFGGAVDAGPLDPPAGPVSPTGRFGPRTEISDTTTPGDADSLFVISQPGSYYLVGNITGVAGKNGIKITSYDVTLDLNGFSLMGEVAGTLDGVNVPDLQRKISIRNGSVRDWGGDGVDASPAVAILLRDLVARSNGGCGLLIGVGTVSECIAALNTGNGIQVGNGSEIFNCAARDNDGVGLVTGFAGSVIQCKATLNDGGGILVDLESTVIACTVRGSGGQGILASSGSSVIDCTVSHSGGDGINLATSGLVTNCVSNENTGCGIQASDSLVRGNTAMNNTGGNICATDSTVIENHAP